MYTVGLSERSVAMERHTCNESTCNTARTGDYAQGEPCAFAAPASTGYRGCTEHRAADESQRGDVSLSSEGKDATLPAGHRRAAAPLPGSNSTARLIGTSRSGKSAKAERESDCGYHQTTIAGIGWRGESRRASSSCKIGNRDTKDSRLQRRIHFDAFGYPAGRHQAPGQPRGFPAVFPVSWSECSSPAG